MTKEQTARAATVAVLLVALGVGTVRKAGWRLPAFSLMSIAARPAAAPGQEPQDAIYAMLAAARAGDVKAYLARYTGQAEAALRQALTETTERGFAQYLRDSNSGLKGVAVSDPQKITDLEVKVRVEYIYQDRNEAQIAYIENGPGGWKISRTEGDERVRALVPYGTPVK
jgi:hypothetical protein